MTTPDPFRLAARAEAEARYGFLSDAACFEEGAAWARDHLTATLTANDSQSSQSGPTDAEVEAALTALLISESIALGQTADEAADYAIRELEARDLTNLRTGVRCALAAAYAVRRDEEKRDD